MSELTIHAQFPPELGAVANARQTLHPLRGKLSTQKFEDATLLVSELVTNSIRHSGMKRGQSVDLDVQLIPRTLHIEVTDPGRGFSPEMGRRTGRTGEGWGLFLLDHLATRWGVDRGASTTVWFEIDCDGGKTRSRQPAAIGREARELRANARTGARPSP